MFHSRTEIRQFIRSQRQALSLATQQSAAQQLITQCQANPVFQQAQHIALYLAIDGEIDTQPLIHWLWQQKKHVYLPVLHPFSKGHLLFLHYTQHSAMVKNRYGILEPKLQTCAIKPVIELDVICTPLVAFDDSGQRLGMGGGYYDRTLAPWFETQLGATPIGLAHDCQQVPQLPSQHWDIPLPMIITPSQTWHWENPN